MKSISKHPSHKTQVSRLNRAIGQLEGIKRMIEKGQYCVNIMIQLRAARSAVKNIELSVLETHMHSCLAKSCDADEKTKQEKIAEIIELLKKYE